MRSLVLATTAAILVSCSPGSSTDVASGAGVGLAVLHAPSPADRALSAGAVDPAVDLAGLGDALLAAVPAPAEVPVAPEIGPAVPHAHDPAPVAEPVASSRPTLTVVSTQPVERLVEGIVDPVVEAVVGLTTPAATAPPVAEGLVGILACIRAHESTGNYQATNGKYRGAYQFDQSTWESVGGTGDPVDASPAEQDHRAALLYEIRGGQPWPNARC